MSEKIEHLKNILEAAILTAGEPLSMVKILTLFPEDAAPAKEDLLEALEALQQDCMSRGVELKKIGKAWRYQSKEEYAPWLRRLSETRPARFSRAMLETLAIIAYRQPVTRGDIEEIRGVSVSTDILRTLLNREWVKQVGHRDVPGHPGLYGTTREFLEYFNLGSLSELPPLPEKRDTVDIADELNIRLPLTITTGNDDREQTTSEMTEGMETVADPITELDNNSEIDAGVAADPSAQRVEDIPVDEEREDAESEVVGPLPTQLEG